MLIGFQESIYSVDGNQQYRHFSLTTYYLKEILLDMFSWKVISKSIVLQEFCSYKVSGVQSTVRTFDLTRVLEYYFKLRQVGHREISSSSTHVSGKRRN